MKKLLRVLLVLVGIGAVVYIVTQKQTEARRLWDETLAKIPTPGCDCCCDDADDE
ncbi:MAG: hypothetical protein FWD55_08480 [Propionibacteriaceae bacterium]|nr:hypothetical protein [Propionibacteriaceae bacterium]